MNVKSSTTRRFETLDLLRGLAALAILTLHYSWPAGKPPLGHAYLAVDFFFVLSGFVVTDAYHQWLEDGASMWGFLRVRLIRLYPLYAVGNLLAAALTLVTLIHHGAGPIDLGRWLATVATASFLLPTPASWSTDSQIFFPLNLVAWSLFWEIAVNALYAALARNLRPWLLATLLATGAVAMIAGSLIYGYGSGWLWQGAAFGGARALFGFFAGVAIWKARSILHAPALPSWLLVVFFVAVLIPRRISGGSVYDVVVAMVAFPLLVWLGSTASIGPRLGRTGFFLGFVSYPLYIVHLPLLFIVYRFDHAVFGNLPNLPIMIGVPLYAFGLIAIAAVLANGWDEPARRLLTFRFALERPNRLAQAAP
jgi:peptidoglycan/LPS O-acetylase OafA/YrhL